jgi:D-serine deaminase-like pyridoxal phosphate-dependent protein
MQLDRGAVGLAVAKVGESEVMLAANPPGILVAYPVIGGLKLRRLMDVARKTPVTVALDSLEAAQGLSRAAHSAGLTLGVLVEANVGLDRCGLEPGADLVSLAAAVSGLPGLRLEGVEFYSGHVWLNTPEGPERFEQVKRKAAQIREDFQRAGLEATIFSGGTTPTLFHSHEIAAINEIRPGTYVFNDAMQVKAGACTWDDCAATILTTVVSTARQGFALIDGGSKTFTSDRLPGPEVTFGRVVESPEVLFYNMNEEHGYLDLRPAGKSYRVGDRLRIVPNHVCVAVNMHEKIYGVRCEQVETVLPVEGRGKLQ